MTKINKFKCQNCGENLIFDSLSLESGHEIMCGKCKKLTKVILKNDGKVIRNTKEAAGKNLEKEGWKVEWT